MVPRKMISPEIIFYDTLNFFLFEALLINGSFEDLCEDIASDCGEKSYQQHRVHPFSLSRTSTLVYSRRICLIFTFVSLRPIFPFYRWKAKRAMAISASFPST